MPVRPIAKVAMSKAESAAICAVMVVPMLAPIVMVAACVRVMTPALTRPTTMVDETDHHDRRERGALYDGGHRRAYAHAYEV